MNTDQIKALVTERIIEKLEAGTIPWRKPWAGGVMPTNLASGHTYKGINIFQLSCSDYASPYWLTYAQAKKLGGNVKKGEKSTPVIFWKIVHKADPEDPNGFSTFPILKYYRVFNIEQCENLPADKIPETKQIDFNPIEKCEDTVSSYEVKTTHGGGRACYYPSTDEINMPEPEAFDSEADYYSTRFHEMAHSTGHKSRLARKSISGGVSPFGSTDYGEEELIAEMTACMLAAHCGIENNTIDNSAAYVASWLKKIKRDNNLVIHAAGKAQKAFELITGQK
jgi:antirestriction protein ArdC